MVADYRQIARDAIFGNPPDPNKTPSMSGVVDAFGSVQDDMNAIESATAFNDKAAVACATTGNITLSGEQTIDGVVTSASRVLVWTETDSSKNGIYVSGAGAWTRATDADTAAELVNAAVLVLGGTVNGGIRCKCTLSDATGFTLNTDPLVFVQIDAAPVAGSDGLNGDPDGNAGLLFLKSHAGLAIDLAARSYGIRDFTTPANTAFGAATDLVTFTRAGSSWRVNESGHAELMTTNAPRFDYDIDTGKPLGVTFENPLTAQLLYSRDLTNAAWTKSNMGTAAGLGFDGGSTSGTVLTASAADATISQAGLETTGIMRTGAIMLKRKTGTGTIKLSMDDGATWKTIKVGRKWKRFKHSQNVGSPVFKLLIATSGDELYSDFATLEPGTVATSFLASTGTAAARVADNLSGLLSDIPLPLDNGFSIELSALPSQDLTSGGHVLFTMDDGTTNNRIQIRNGTAGFNFINTLIVIGGVTELTSTVNQSTTKAFTYRLVFTPSTTDAGKYTVLIEYNGSPVTLPGSYSLPSGLTTYRLGGNSSGTTSKYGAAISNFRIIAEPASAYQIARRDDSGFRKPHFDQLVAETPDPIGVTRFVDPLYSRKSLVSQSPVTFTGNNPVYITTAMRDKMFILSGTACPCTCESLKKGATVRITVENASGNAGASLWVPTGYSFAGYANRRLVLTEGIYEIARGNQTKYYVRSLTGGTITNPDSTAPTWAYSFIADGQSLAENLLSGPFMTYFQQSLEALGLSRSVKLISCGVGSSYVRKSDGGVSGNSLYWWNDITNSPGTLLTNAIATIQAAITDGVPIPALIQNIWHQNTALFMGQDTTTIANIVDAVLKIVNYYRTYLFTPYGGGAASALLSGIKYSPWQLGADDTNYGTDGSHSMARRAIAEIVATGTNCFVGPDYYDAFRPWGDPHIGDDWAAEMAKRLAENHDNILNTAGHNMGLTVDSWSVKDDRHIAVKYKVSTTSSALGLGASKDLTNLDPRYAIAPEGVAFLPNAAPTRADVPIPIVDFAVGPALTVGSDKFQEVIYELAADCSDAVPVMPWGVAGIPMRRGRVLYDVGNDRPPVSYDPRPIT